MQLSSQFRPSHIDITDCETRRIELTQRSELFLDIQKPFMMIAFHDLFGAVVSANSIRGTRVTHLGFFGEQGAIGAYFGNGLGSLNIRAFQNTTLVYSVSSIANQCEDVIITSNPNDVFLIDNNSSYYMQSLTKSSCIWILNNNFKQNISISAPDIGFEFINIDCLPTPVETVNDTFLFKTQCSTLIQATRNGQDSYMKIRYDSDVAPVEPGFKSSFDFRSQNEPMLIQVEKGPIPIGPTLAPRPDFPDAEFDEMENFHQNPRENDEYSTEKAAATVLLLISSLSILFLMTPLPTRYPH